MNIENKTQYKGNVVRLKTDLNGEDQLCPMLARICSFCALDCSWQRVTVLLSTTLLFLHLCTQECFKYDQSSPYDISKGGEICL